MAQASSPVLRWNRDGHLAIAKFPHLDDEINTVRREAVALSLAKQAAIEVPQWRLETVAGKACLILLRFDREDQHRIPFLSAMSMLGARDNERHSYLELVDSLRQYGAMPQQDLAQLWRRMVFNVLISNTDDHLRNHGFLFSNPGGWRLSGNVHPCTSLLLFRVFEYGKGLENGITDKSF